MSAALDERKKAGFPVFLADFGEDRWNSGGYKSCGERPSPLVLPPTSRNLSRGREQLPYRFASDIRILEMLDDPGCWPKGAGLYCAMQSGTLRQNAAHFQIQPLSNHAEEIVGATVSILGLVFVIMLTRPLPS
ncbi:hypothetical protein A9Z06_08920 [Rhizobium sp. YK2]|nr:hypothetical protein A9Z06_08920 [Rhizobium sp. YK2]